MGKWLDLLVEGGDAPPRRVVTATLTITGPDGSVWRSEVVEQVLGGGVTNGIAVQYLMDELWFVVDTVGREQRMKNERRAAKQAPPVSAKLPDVS